MPADKGSNSSNMATEIELMGKIEICLKGFRLSDGLSINRIDIPLLYFHFGGYFISGQTPPGKIKCSVMSAANSRQPLILIFRMTASQKMSYLEDGKYARYYD